MTDEESKEVNNSPNSELLDTDSAGVIVSKNPDPVESTNSRIPSSDTQVLNAYPSATEKEKNTGDKTDSTNETVYHSVIEPPTDSTKPIFKEFDPYSKLYNEKCLNSEYINSDISSFNLYKLLEYVKNAQDVKAALTDCYTFIIQSSECHSKISSKSSAARLLERNTNIYPE